MLLFTGNLSVFLFVYQLIDDRLFVCLFLAAVHPGGGVPGCSPPKTPKTET
jgi:hypothetical protein